MADQRLISDYEEGKGPGKQAVVFMDPPTDKACDFGRQPRLNHYLVEYADSALPCNTSGCFYFLKQFMSTCHRLYQSLEPLQ